MPLAARTRRRRLRDPWHGPTAGRAGHRGLAPGGAGEVLKPGWVQTAREGMESARRPTAKQTPTGRFAGRAGRSTAALPGADLHAVHAPALELAARQDRLARVVAALVGEVVLVGVLAHDLAGVPEGAGHGPLQPGHQPSPPDPAPTRCSAWRARSSAVGNSPEGAHRWDSSGGASARTGSRRPPRVWEQTR